MQRAACPRRWDTFRVATPLRHFNDKPGGKSPRVAVVPIMQA